MSKFFNSANVHEDSLVLRNNLIYSWTIWYHSKLKKQVSQKLVEEGVLKPEEEHVSSSKPHALDRYLLTTKQISFPKFTLGNEVTSDIETLEQLWISLYNLKPAIDLSIGAEFLVFKTGIKPIWEDPLNAKGGRWIFRFPRRYNSSGTNSRIDAKLHKLRVALIWERLVLKTCGASLFTTDNPFGTLLYDDISGLALSARKDEFIIGVWNSNLFMDKYRRQEREKSGKDQMGKDSDNIEEATGRLEDDLQYDIDEMGSLDGLDKKSQKFTPSTGRSLICGAILKIMRECDAIIAGSDISVEVDNESGKRIDGVTFEYNLHNSTSNSSSSSSHSHSHGHSHFNGGQHHSGYQGHHTNGRGHNRRYNNTNAIHRQKENREPKEEATKVETELNTTTNTDGEETGASKFFFANLGRRRRGIENGVEGGEPSGLLFGARRKQMQLQLQGETELS